MALCKTLVYFTFQRTTSECYREYIDFPQRKRFMVNKLKVNALNEKYIETATDKVGSDR